MTKGIFITATGTDVGKTFVSALIVKKFKDAGFNCGYYKPVLSWAEIIDGKVVPGDCDYVKKIANLDGNPMDFLSFVFKHPLSPHLAARIENNPINLSKIKTDFDVKKAQHDYLLVEGAGGIVCPMDLTKDKPFLIEDIIKTLNMSVIIVAPAGLGSINSAVTTVEYAKNHGINVKGIILNNYNETDLMHTDNKLQIENLTKVPVIATVKVNEQDLNIEINKLTENFEEI
jgi:dethiobiotin synthetase